MKRFDYIAVAWMGEYAFTCAGTIELEKGQNGYVEVRRHLLADDSMYDRVESVRRADFRVSRQEG